MKTKVEFYSQGYRLAGNLFIPRRNAPCVLLCHGLSSSKDSGEWTIFADRLYNAGFASLGFNFRSCGYDADVSEGDADATTLTTRITDYRSALSFLEATEGIDAGRLGVIGSSLGGCVIIAAGDSRPRAHAILAAPLKFRVNQAMLDAFKEKGYFEFKDAAEPYPFHITEALYEDVNQYNLAELAKKLSRVLFIHGTRDAVPVDDARTLFENAQEPKRLVLIEGGSHGFTDKPEHLDTVIDLIIEWFKKYL